jgi:16S rRNA (adenine1518-N6/adenine1519-N6)-dimethyltransferase
MTRVKDKLHSLGVKPSKNRGQNFLIDENVLEAIFESGRITADDNVVEIGPGLGALTKLIYSIKPHVAIEIESQFCKKLSEEYPNLKLVNEDVRKVDFSAFGKEQVVYGNLPYSFSTEIIFHLAEFRPYIKRSIFLLQKEFAERMAATPGGKDYGVLSISVQTNFAATLGREVGGNCFHPPTKVTSKIIVLEPLKEPLVPVEKQAWFKKTVKASFLQRRKKLSNSIKAASLIPVADSLDLIRDACLKVGIDPNRRAETLSIQEFAKLADSLSQIAA